MVVAGAAEVSILVFAIFSTIFSTAGLGAGAATGAGAGGGPWLGVGTLTWTLLGVAGACPRGLTPGFESLPEPVLTGVPDGGAPLSLPAVETRCTCLSVSFHAQDHAQDHFGDITSLSLHWHELPY